MHIWHLHHIESANSPVLRLQVEQIISFFPTFCIVEVLSSCRKAGDSDSNSPHSKEDSGMASGADFCRLILNITG